MEKLFSGKTLQEAKDQAYQFFAELGINEDNVDTQILEQPVKRLFGGFKGEFKINAIVEDEVIARAEEKEAVIPPPAKAPEPPVAEKNTVSTKPEEVSADVSGGVSSDVIVNYLTRILNQLGAKDFTINVIEKDNVTVFDIIGEKLGVAIGRRGETLDALQYLSILANNRSGQQYSRISVDCNGYRNKRSETLELLAVRTAKKVLAQGRRITLEPMNPYERRIIHGKVSEIEGVYSNSIGDEPYRKVVISANVPKHRRNDYNKERPTRTGGTGGRSYKQSTGFQTSFERDYKREKKDEVEISEDTVKLEKSASNYGKIEL